MPEGKDYEVLREGEDIIVRIDYGRHALPPSIEDDGQCMASVIGVLKEVSGVTRIVLYQKRNYEYDFNQTEMLIEIAKLHNKIVKEDIVNYHKVMPPSCQRYATGWYPRLQTIVYRLMKSDPLGAYVELIRTEREEKIKLAKIIAPEGIECERKFIEVLRYLAGLLEKTKLVAISKPYLVGYKLGDRSVYRRLFTAAIKPDFMFTRFMASYPPEGEELDSYMVGETEITIFGLPDSVQYIYHMLPPEFKLSEEKYDLLDTARKILAEHKPKRSEFVEPERMRQVFTNVGSDLIEELAEHKGLKLKEKELKELTDILVRYTVGFGLIEVLLSDEKIQDVSINSPMGQIPIFVVHQDFDDCVTNIVPTVPESESWASKLRMISGRPLDEANPLLDTELELPGATTRVSAITKPLDPTGLAFSFRRHRDKPWTLPLFIKVKMINPLAAGLLSFLIDGTRTLLIAGTRSSGKSAFLSSMLIEIMRRYRIITVEDTLELPTKAMRQLGFNIQPMKVAPALAMSSTEMSASDGIRATLRLGDSSLIVGEVRSAEAKALYEAMRVGAAANVVAGTIHGDSPFGIFDRVVNDIGVPKTSFKATDICIIANPVRSADGIHKYRRITQITEVRKTWTEDPMLEGGFVDLMKYDVGTDGLVASGELMNGDSEILKLIAGNIKEFAGSWDAVWENIQLRGQIKETQVKQSLKAEMPDLLEAPFTIECNDMFHKISEKVREEVGTMDTKRIFFDWNEWLKRTIKKLSMQKTK